MLDLVRLSSRRLFPPGGEDLYRQIARLTDLSPDMEVLDVACGKGIGLEYFVREYGVHGTGVDEDPHLISLAEQHVREEGLATELGFQNASPGDLPFRDETFDVVMGEVGLAASAEPRTAIEELVRVTRPGGRLVLVQLVWKSAVEDSRKKILSDHLGARPLMGTELRKILLEAGVGDLHTEDWTDEDSAFRGQVRKPFPDFAELFTLGEKLGILRRAWKQWGWKGVRTVFQREAEVHRLLTRDRILGLNLLIGSKASSEPRGEAGTAEGEGRPSQGVETSGEGEATGEVPGEGAQTSGLPLFGGEEGGEGS
ncbi:class I SAM-dependent methyltransferase [Gemmatimonadota bacterium]